MTQHDGCGGKLLFSADWHWLLRIVVAQQITRSHNIVIESSIAHRSHLPDTAFDSWTWIPMLIIPEKKPRYNGIERV